MVIYSDLSAEAKPFIPESPQIILKKLPRTRKPRTFRYYCPKVTENVITKFITNPFDMPDLFNEYRFQEYYLKEYYLKE